MDVFEIVGETLVKYTGRGGHVTIPGRVKIIGCYAFGGCSNLTSVTIPDGITSIGYRAFYGCTGLTSITLPDSVTSIGVSAFSGCSGITSATIGNGVTRIGGFAFSGCSGMASITIGNGVTSIGERAFSDCYGLTSVYYTGNVTGWCRITFDPGAANPLYYAHNLYLNDGLLTELVIPDTVIAIKAYAFIGCSGLTSVTIGNNVATIGNYAFYGCSGLASITIPDSVTSIGGSAFSGCSDLTAIVIPDSVTSIGNGAFRLCTSMTSITIGNNVTSIGEYAFFGSGLTSRLGNYKAFILTPDGKLKCRDKTYTVGKRSFAEGPLVLCENGIHYCTNLFDVFNYYNGEYGKHFVIAECKVSKENIGTKDYDSKRCARSIVPEHILSREEIIGILNA